MQSKVSLLLFGLFLFSDITIALHDEEESTCSGDAGIMLQRLVNDCFSDSFSGRPPKINFCNENGQLNCPAIKSVLSISPSCNYCNNRAENRLQCFVKQTQNAACAINHFQRQVSCEKVKGQCQKKYVTTLGIQDVTTRGRSTRKSEEVITSSPSTEFAKYGYDRDHGKHNKNDDECKPCECSQTGETTGISIGLAIGLLIAGLVIGAVVTGVICVCVPNMNRSGENRRRSVDKSPTQEDRFQAQDSRPSVADNTLPAESTITYPVLPSAPPQSQGSIQTGYHTLGGMTNNRDSHMYSGLQPDSPEYFEPMADNSYQSPKNQPMKSPKTVGSPVYQEFTDSVIPSALNNNSKPNNDRNVYNSLSQSQPIKTTDTNTDATSHSYFVLDPQNEADSSNTTANERPVSNHPYFILEKQKENQVSVDQSTDYSEIPNETDKTYHDYFVLEKQ